MGQNFSSFIFIFLLGVGTGFFLFSPRSDISKQLAQIPTVTISPTTSVLSGNSETAKVTRVIDGDTIEIEGGKKVRYIGMNTPETVDPRKPVECFGKEASNENKKLVNGQVVRLEKDVSDTDRYGRLLRFVYLENTPSAGSSGELFVNQYLVKEGYAYIDTVPPDVKYADAFRQLQDQARQQNKGLWATCPQ